MSRDPYVEKKWLKLLVKLCYNENRGTTWTFMLLRYYLGPKIDHFLLITAAKFILTEFNWVLSVSICETRYKPIVSHLKIGLFELVSTSPQFEVGSSSQSKATSPKREEYFYDFRSNVKCQPLFTIEFGWVKFLSRSWKPKLRYFDRCKTIIIFFRIRYLTQKMSTSDSRTKN